MKHYTLGLYEKAMPGSLNFSEKLSAAGKAGFDFLEISIDETEEKLARLDWSKETRGELIQAMHETKVPIRTMCLSGHRRYPLGSEDPLVCARGMEIMEKAIGLAEDLGIRIIQLAGYDVYYEESTEQTRERFAKNLVCAVEMAATAGVTLGFETMETEFMNTVGKAMAYVEHVNSVYLGVYPDTGNIQNAATAYRTDVYEDIKRGAGHTVAMHLKESVPGKFREIPFGTGHVDFKKMIHAAWHIGVRKYVAEFWDIGSENWMEELVYANQMMTAYLENESR